VGGGGAGGLDYLNALTTATLMLYFKYTFNFRNNSTKKYPSITHIALVVVIGNAK
jgi:hypothetical protein